MLKYYECFYYIKNKCYVLRFKVRFKNRSLESREGETNRSVAIETMSMELGLGFRGFTATALQAAHLSSMEAAAEKMARMVRSQASDSTLIFVISLSFVPLPLSLSLSLAHSAVLLVWARFVNWTGHYLTKLGTAVNDGASSSSGQLTILF